MSKRFGEAILSQRYTQLDLILQSQGPFRPTTARWVTEACYQKEHEIFDHGDARALKEHPLGLVRLHDKENVLEGGRLYKEIRLFATYRIHEHFGIDIDAYFDLPPHIARFLLDVSRSITQQESKQTDHLAEQFKDVDKNK